MPKIQILDQKQTMSLYHPIYRELEDKFHKRLKEFEDKYYTDKEIKTIIKEDSDLIEEKSKTDASENLYKKIIKLEKEINDSLKEYGENTKDILFDSEKQQADFSRATHGIYILDYNYKDYKEDPKKWEKAENDSLREMAKGKIAKKYNFNCSYTRKLDLQEDINARLSVTTIDNYDDIKEHIINSINIDDYFQRSNDFTF